MKDVRIQKVLAEQGLCSRRAAEQIIREGRIKLNGHPVSLGDKMDTARDLLTVDGQRVMVPRKTEKYYYMMNKPRGYITTASDERGRKTVMELVKDVPARLYPIGRLDKDSEGLLLLTNDGDFANLLTHPSHGVSKLYRVTVRPHATEEQLIALTDGVVLDDGTKTLPAVIRVVSDEPERTVLEMTIREGKNRQIRRMCEAVNLTVIRLRRTALGAVRLSMLQPGDTRPLTPAEVVALRTAASRGKVTLEISKNTEENARRAAQPSRGGRGQRGRSDGAPRAAEPTRLAGPSNGSFGSGTRMPVGKPSGAHAPRGIAPKAGGYASKPAAGGYAPKPAAGGYAPKPAASGYASKPAASGYASKPKAGGYARKPSGGKTGGSGGKRGGGRP